MTPELLSIFAVAIALSVQLWRGQRENREAQKETRNAIAALRESTARDIAALRESTGRDIAELRERMARLEGLFAGFTQREKPAA